MTKTATIFMCSDCGNEYLNWQGKCDSCGAWNTIVQMKNEKLKIKNNNLILPEIITLGSSRKLPAKEDRLTTIAEFDRVLGGGLVVGGVVLLTGEPGIGKSTLLLQIASWVANQGSVCYISAEESVAQVQERANRLKIYNQNLLLASASNVASITNLLQKQTDLKLVVIDSIQTVYDAEYPSAPGSVVQVRQCALRLTEWAKTHGVTLMITSHINKEGILAGPKTLEHLVDTVLYLEGDRFHNLRMVRGVKNRFGPTDEVGVFAMMANGLQVIANPSELFLAERQANPIGSAVTAVVEGMRPFLVEVQALTTSVQFGYPKRRAIGVDPNRLDLVLAVLEKKAKIKTSRYDIFCSMVGGIKTKEPAVDLAIAMAVVSSIKNKPLPSQVLYFGEISLTGEIRSVRLAKRRINEAKRFDFTVSSAKSVLGALQDLS